MNKKEKIETFSDILNILTEKDIREFAEELLTESDDYFYHLPASSTGKYHPEFAQGEGGLVRHTKAVTYFLLELVNSGMYQEIDSRSKELLVVAAIVHDIKKYGDGSKTDHTKKDHPELASEFLHDVYKKYQSKIPYDDMLYIDDAVLRHMGVHGKEKPVFEYEKLLHVADMLASRREINLDFENKGEYSVNFEKYK